MAESTCCASKEGRTHLANDGGVDGSSRNGCESSHFISTVRVFNFKVVWSVKDWGQTAIVVPSLEHRLVAKDGCLRCKRIHSFSAKHRGRGQGTRYGYALGSHEHPPYSDSGPETLRYTRKIARLEKALQEVLWENTTYCNELQSIQQRYHATDEQNRYPTSRRGSGNTAHVVRVSTVISCNESCTTRTSLPQRCNIICHKPLLRMVCVPCHAAVIPQHVSTSPCDMQLPPMWWTSCQQLPLLLQSTMKSLPYRSLPVRIACRLL